MTVTLAVNSNPSSTEFAIYESATNKYVQANGSLGASAVWQTYTTWGGASGQKLGPLDFGSETSKEFRKMIEAPWFAYWLKDKGKLDLTQLHRRRLARHSNCRYQRQQRHNG